ncbi:MAG: glycosyltransferase family 2 protein [Lachnospiraceae bacterium]|nr:glycosyltransferase family 2 protein [Lachnospiraceae bacterium]
MNPVSVLLSVMKEGDCLDYLSLLNIQTECVIVSQCDEEGEEVFRQSFGRVLVHKSRERGLSRSRNLGLSLSETDCVIFCDNDVRYTDQAFEQIGDAFRRYPDAGILVFFVERPERHAPVYGKERDMSRPAMMKIFSPEIAVRKSRIGDLRFDTDFGAGAKYSMGEENIFLFEAKRRHIRVVYIPVRIGGLIPNESSWFTGYHEKFFRDRGAGYEAMEPGWWQLFSIQFLIRKRKLYRKDAQIFSAYRWMAEGRREYRLYCRRKNEREGI